MIITDRLRKIEETHNVKIVHACESGSRASGFESEDSDFDIRFVYHYPLNFYLNVINKEGDVIEITEGDYDFVGWDLKKALHLFSQQNCQILEWLESPIIYRHELYFQYPLLDLRNNYMNPSLCIYHYFNMGFREWNEFLEGKNGKKLLYALRCLFSANWIQTKGKFPILDFYTLYSNCTFLNPELSDEIKYYHDLKKRGFESDNLEVGDSLKNFVSKGYKDIANYLNHIDGHYRPIANKEFCEKVNELFISTVNGDAYNV